MNVMKKFFVLTILVIGLALLVAGCAGMASAGSSTTSSSTSTSLGQGSTTTGSNQGTDTTTVDQGTADTSTGDTSTIDTSTGDTSTGDTSTTLPSDTTTTTAPVTSSTSQTVAHEQTEARLAYAGSWSKVSASSASGGSFALANNSGATLTIRFVGTHLAWIAKESPAYGQAKVTVDGGAAHTVDLYNANTVWKKTVWQTGTLSASTAHTVVISWTGKKDSAATGTNIDVDAIQVTGVLTGRYQQNNTKFAYSGTWNTVSNTSASGGGFKYANSSGASVTIHFTGIDLAWIAKKGPDYGEAKVTVDGKKTYTVNLYSASATWQKRLWSTGILPMGAHTVEIHWLGAKGSGATGTNIDVDAIDVTGTLN
jgi:hypothetical protein